MLTSNENPFAACSALPDSFKYGFPRSFLKTSTSIREKERTPVPRAFEKASLAAQFPAYDSNLFFFFSKHAKICRNRITGEA